MVSILHTARYFALLLITSFTIAACGGSGGGGGSAPTPTPTPTPDIQPDAFELGDPVTVNTPQEQVESAVITVAGIDAGELISISIENGEYKIGIDGAYTPEPGMVSVGDMVQVRVTAASMAPLDDETATLDIGGVTDTFTVSTEDITPPEPVVYFPTPSTMTEGNYAVLRGVVTEDFGPISSVIAEVLDPEGNPVAQLEGNGVVTAGTGENLADGWSLRVDLATSPDMPVVNQIRITAMSSTGPGQTAEVNVNIAQTGVAEETLFPLGSLANSGFANFGRQEDGAVLMDVRAQTLYMFFSRDVYSINMNSGERTLLLDSPDRERIRGMISIDDFQSLLMTSSSNGFEVLRSPLDSFDMTSQIGVLDRDPRAMLPGTSVDSILVATGDTTLAGQADIVRLNLASGESEILSGPSTTAPEEGMLTGVYSLLRLSDNEILATTANTDVLTGDIIQVDLESGAQVPLFSEPLGTVPFGMTWVEDGEMFIFSTASDISVPGALYVHDFLSDAPTIFLDAAVDDGKANSMHLPRGIQVDQERKVAYVSISYEQDRFLRGSIYVLDLESKERVVLTRHYIENIDGF